MGHYAKVLNDTVTQVIVAEPEFFDSFVDTSPGEWIQTSYNTRSGEHVLGGTPLRGNFAGVGYKYNREHDVFHAPQPYPNWVLNQTTWSWEPPVPMPVDGKLYTWNIGANGWVEVVEETAPVAAVSADATPGA